MVTMTEAKVNTILVGGARSFLAKISFAIRPVASPIGTLVSTFPRVELALPPPYITDVLNINIAIWDSPGDFEGLISVSPASKAN